MHNVIVNGGPAVKDLLPTANTVRSWLLTAFKERKPDVKQSLATATSKVNISFDASTTLDDKSLLAIVGHWIDKDRQLRTALLTLKELKSHGGNSDVAPLLKAVIRNYDLADKLGAFQMDNADNNDTCLEALASEFKLNTPEVRLRCQGHSINLVVKALLYGEGVSKFQKELSEASDEKVSQLWRSKGAIGKLHNLVVYITRSPLRTAAFNEAQQAEADEVVAFYLRLKKDSGVRWNSVHTMIQRALKLRRAIERYCAEWQRPKDKGSIDILNDFLDTEDWEELHHYEELLRPFAKATKRSEGKATAGSHGALYEVLPGFDYLFKKLEDASNEILATPNLFTDHYRHCVNAAFVKLRDYYRKTDQSRLYRAAVALHPCYRYSYFERNWSGLQGGKADVANAKQAVQSLFESYVGQAIPPSPPTSAPSASLDDDEDHDWKAFFSYEADDDIEQAHRRKRQKQETELERFMTDDLDVFYIQMEQQEDGSLKRVRKTFMDNPLDWWRQRGESRYPTLAKMAYDLFSIPAMSAECERVFSNSRKMITDERYSLKVDIIEADQCLKSWLKQQLVDGAATWQILASQIQEAELQEAEQARCDDIS